MPSVAGFPSLLLFGPQTELPLEHALEDLRRTLNHDPRLSALKDAVADLPRFWHSLVAFDSELGRVPGDKCLASLSQWLIDGGSFPHLLSDALNHYALPVTVLLQISQYARYLTHLGDDAHRRVLESVQTGGVQGFCAGFLSAVAVAGSRSESELGSAAAAALRFAVSIGAYVDLDGACSQESTEYSCVAVRWRDGSKDDERQLHAIVESYPEAYISSINDDACVTVTLKTVNLRVFNQDMSEQGLRTKAVHVRGRFHNACNSYAAETLSQLAQSSKEFNELASGKLHAPVRSTVDGEIIVESSLTRIAQEILNNTLLKTADWCGTVKSAVNQLPGINKTVVFAGLGSHVPLSLVQSSNLQIFALESIQGSKPKLPNGLPNGTLPFNGLSNGIDPTSQYPPHSIAIVGMAGKFPGADSVDELWDLLAEKKVMVEPAPVDKFRLPHTGDYANVKWWGNFLRDREAFDHRFFKKASREAIAWDPQQRILLEVLYEALESAGYFGASSTPEPEDYGCYIGAVMNNYYDNMSCQPATAFATLGTSRCFLSGYMSHYFGWTGPSLTIDTACSSSLVAINTACRAIWSGECSRAVAGGTNVICSPFDYQNLSAAGFLSPSGQCKPFDAAADGYCRGEAVGVVVLKRLSDAVKENDNILGVIVGSAANQNHNSSHVTVPHTGSQVDLYRKVMKLSNVEPESVSYVEAHGTGTGVGDPVEVRSIRDAFGGPQRDSLLHFGSIKGSIGHTESTAGVAGLIKVLLMMRHGKIPAQASFNTLNPKLPALDEHQMAIPTTMLPWNPSVRIACVNSYGAAGSNSAVMLRESPPSAKPCSSVSLSKYPLFISAASINSLSMYTRKLLAWLKDGKAGSANLASLTFNLADRGNHALAHTLSTTVDSVRDLESKLEGAASGLGIIKTQDRKPVVLVFGGQESTSVGLSKEVYQTSNIFRHHLDACDEILISKGLESMYPSIFQQEPISNTVTLHAALFAIQYASAQAWIDCGLKVDAVVGHSFGQLTAFCVSGALSLQDAITLVTGRASLVRKHWGPDAGSMLFLQADRQAVEQSLMSLKAQDNEHYAEIACYNGPKSHVVVGSSKSIDTLESSIGDSIRTKRLKVTNGFHSKFTEPLLPHLAELARDLEWKTPTIHLETCDEFESKTDPDFRIASHHTRSAVFFQKAIERLNTRFSQITWLEADRGSSVMGLVKGSLSASQSHTFLAPQLTSTDAQASLADTTVELWKAGYATQYWAFHRSQKHNYEKLHLPSYQFEKTRHWLGFNPRSAARQPETAEIAEPKTHELFSMVSPKDKANQEVLFRIDPEAERFKALLGGHVMAGQALAPASLYFEIVSRAALLLKKNTADKTYVPSIEDLVMKSPIGLDTSKEIILTLKRVEHANPSWTFSITTQSKGVKAPPLEVSNGQVYLKEHNDAQTTKMFKRFETLTGFRRYEELINHPEAEMMQGRHIYRAFNNVVHYGEAFHGIKQVACVRNEAAGKVVITPDINDPVDQRLCDTPMTDSFMQFAGFLVNYFNNPNMDNVFVCSKIEHIEIGGEFDPDAGEWIVYSTMSEDGAGHATSDAYVFEAKSKKMVMAAFGFSFAKMPRRQLARMLETVNKAGPSREKSASFQVTPTPPPTPPTAASVPKKKKTTTSKPSKRQELFNILSDVTDVPLQDLKDESTLEDLGIDSLMATEVLNDIRSILGLTIDLTTFLFLPNIKALVTCIDRQADQDGGVSEESDADSGYAPSELSKPVEMSSPTKAPEPLKLEDSLKRDKLPQTFSEVIPVPDVTQTVTNGSRPSIESERPTITSAVTAFEEVRLDYDKVAKFTQALDFWRDAYPHQARLVLAYVVEAFAQLGCDMNKLQAGGHVPYVKALNKHKLLVRQFYRVLEDGNLIAPNGAGFTRTDTPIEPATAESIYHEIIDLYPQHANVNKLVRTVGSQMVACLTGEKDGLQIVFGNKETKRTLEDMYEFWPLLRTPNLLLGDFLVNALSNASGDGKFRILEIGAGTGGTTRHIISRLKNVGIPFEYVFSDVSPSLVATAKKYFEGVDGMSFEVINIEEPPKREYLQAFHGIIATNCIHATRHLDVCLRHLRQMLREDGALTLVEITRNMFWLDIVVGLFEGWWVFDDGRTHALVNEKHWEREMKKAGFSDVLWTDGESAESKIVRVIAAFPSKTASTPRKAVEAVIETMVYKRIGDQDIHADVYYPVERSPKPGKMPIALMIHGGSHILFSRKDIRPAQTRLLLEKGFLPVSLDHRMCPEVTLSEGPMVDVCDALDWARHTLPKIHSGRQDLQIDGERVVVVGWSSGGQLAMSLAYTAPSRGLRPPEAILAFYCPTDYEDPWWTHAIQPIGAEDNGESYDVLEAVQDNPITNYGVVGAWEPLSDPRIMTDRRCRIVLHMNWKAQTLPIIIDGLISKKKAAQGSKVKKWNVLPQPSPEKIRAVSSRHQIRQGKYLVPTFLVHGTEDELIPWQQSQATYNALIDRGVSAGLELVQGAPHICDLSSSPESPAWQATLRGYEFISSFVF